MILSILVSLFTSLVVPADTSIHTTVEAQAIVSDAGITPFWMRSLQYGSVPMENPGLILRAWNGKGYNLKKKYDWKYEVEATGWTGKQNDFWLTQAYISGRRGKWELWAGRRKEVYGLGDTVMTSGFYAWSGNALPMPKVQLGTRDYLNFGKGWLGIHMTYSHGWLDNQGPIINGYLHQKTLYGRIGKNNSKINLFGGINQQVMWGGSDGKGSYLGNGLNTYFYVVVPTKNRTIFAVDPNAPWFENNYHYGSHIGSIDLQLKMSTRWGVISIYKQTAYETGRIASLTTVNDGLSGISFKINKPKLINHIIFEYLYTLNQGQYNSGLAKLFGIKDPHPGEIENYFNGSHGGWQYMKRGIGTPLIIFDLESKSKAGYKFSNNAVKAYFLRINGIFSNDYQWQLCASYSFQTYPRKPSWRQIEKTDFDTQTSIAFKFSKLVSKKIKIYTEIAYDNGMTLENSRAIMLGLIYKLN